MALDIILKPIFAILFKASALRQIPVPKGNSLQSAINIVNILLTPTEYTKSNFW